jgi:hypothetical protein
MVLSTHKHASSVQSLMQAHIPAATGLTSSANISASILLPDPAILGLAYEKVLIKSLPAHTSANTAPSAQACCPRCVYAVGALGLHLQDHLKMEPVLRWSTLLSRTIKTCIAYMCCHRSSTPVLFLSDMCLCTDMQSVAAVQDLT